jgi:stearoyl-CoA desaturase (Delta-9 desaturase)
LFHVASKLQLDLGIPPNLEIMETARNHSITPGEAAARAKPVETYGSQKGEPPWFIAFRHFERNAITLATILFVPLTWPLFWLFLISFVVRMWGIEAIYHRYFSHRSYRATRTVQLLLAVLGMQSGQRGPLWWASKHREHHQFVESKLDPHTPTSYGFRYAYVSWLLDLRNRDTNLDAIPDYARFPELRWLNKYHVVPFYGAGLLLVLAGYLGWLGSSITWWSALLWGFYVPATLTLHSVAIVNTFCHMPGIPGGYRRYNTRDASVNRPLIGILGLGGGYHNNHHRHAAVARAGFAWYEFDFCYYVLRGLQGIRVISHLKSEVPSEILKEGNIGAK